MAIPKKGDTAVRTKDGKRFTVDEVIEAGGEDLYKVSAEDGGESLELAAAYFIREHDDAQAEFEVVE